MKKRFVKGFILIFMSLIPFFMVAQENEISVEELYYQDINKREKNDENLPDNVKFALKLQEFLNSNDVDGAIQSFSSMPASLKNDLNLKIVLASLYISKKDFSKAIEVANIVLEKDSENVEAYEIISYASKASGDEKSFIRANEILLKKNPNNPTANITMGENYLIKKEFKKSRDYYKKAMKGDERNTDAIFGVALCSYYLNDIPEAESQLENILEIDEKNSQAFALKGKISAEKYNYANAVQMFEKSIEVGGPNYNTYLDLSLSYKEINQTSKAIEVLDKAIVINPNYFLGYAYLAGIYDEMNNIDKALYNYKKVIETNPDYYFAYEETAILEYHMGNYKNAIKYFEKAYSYANNYSYKMMIASSYLKLKDLQNAKKVLESIMKGLDRESVEYNMARFYHDSYSKNAESSLSQKLTKIDNSYNRGKMLFYMGLYYEINGFEEMAKEYYAKVTSMQAPMFFEYRLAEWGLAN